MKLHPLAMSAAVAVLVPMSAAHADVLVDNLLEPQDATSILPADLWAAQSFVTAASPVILQTIELWLGMRDGNPTITAELRADSPGGPAAALATFTLPTLATGATQIELLPSLPQLALAPDTTYWIVLGVAGAGSFGWTYAHGEHYSGPGALGNYNYSYDGGTSWLNYGNLNPYLVRVTVAPVPEPATAALLLAGLLGVSWFYGRQRRG